YYMRAAIWEKRDRLPQNICNGILLHFLVMAGYCLLHRPYMFYVYYRYPFIFHTVTISAVYLSLVVCAAFVKLLGCYRREPRLSCIWKELTVFGISAVYLLFTLSRTGYLAVAAMAVIVIPVVCLGMKKKVRSLLIAVAMMFFIVLLCFPGVFTAQRIIPAVTAQPETMPIEELPSEIQHGRDLDSNYYITIRRFIHVFQSKVLGIPDEECINQYKTAKADRESDTEYCMAAGGFAADGMLVASTDFSGSEISGQEEGEDSGQMSEEEQRESDAEAYTNGRLDIFKLYYENLNMEGHDDMYITLPDGNLVVHAHNIYLQTAFDHGIPVGIVFILFGFGTLIQSAVYYRRRKDDRLCSALPLALLIVFAVAGLTEWIFHPCNPIAFCLLLMLAPLLTDMGRTVEGTSRDGKEAKHI
ncbi:MAG: O-antigen ligase family protein, partial [Lachnospiraceae bacterium]|nr:O-antigen ligase family protein [Lachnospiraceae bacterium]